MSFVTTEIQDAVAVLTIDRPKALNALNPEVLADLKAAFEAIDQNAVRCVVLTGAGDKSFVAGADIGSMSTMTKAEGEAFGKLGNDVFLMIEHFPLPLPATFMISWPPWAVPWAFLSAAKPVPIILVPMTALP